MLSIEPRWQRFRWVTASPTRPFKLRILNEAGGDVSSTACHIVGGDGGIRHTPSTYPANGLWVGVAERYDVSQGQPACAALVADGTEGLGLHT